MIEIEVFQREVPADNIHILKIWRDKRLISATEIKHLELKKLRDELENELFWLDNYLDNEPKPKYQVGQKVWVDNEGPEEFWIDSYIEGQYGLIEVKDTIWKGYEIESKIFPTRESLIEAQISYWTCLKNEEISTRSDDMSMSSLCSESIRKHHKLEDDVCQHESDGKQYGAIEWGGAPTFKCVSCGKFYR